MSKKGVVPVGEVLCSVVEEVIRAHGLAVVLEVDREVAGRTVTRLAALGKDGLVVVAASVVAMRTVVAGTDHAA